MFVICHRVQEIPTYSIHCMLFTVKYQCEKVFLDRVIVGIRSPLLS